jgi:dTDP-4-dehydrorhamnose 3,5-epimerase
MESLAEVRYPPGVQLTRLTTHADDRGWVTEIYRQAWPTEVNPVQWNASSSQAGILRGVHVHLRHTDYLVVLSGNATVGMRDLRPGANSAGFTVDLVAGEAGEGLQALAIPPRVAHGFLFHEPTIYVCGVSEYFDPSDELGCRWDDEELGIPWPRDDASFSERDAGLPSLSDLRQTLDR